MEEVLKALLQGKFDPSSDAPTCIADAPGVYVICLKPGASLPQTAVVPVLSQWDGLDVIYVGISGKSLRGRDYRQHFMGNNAGRSTLRKSLGVLFGYKQIPRDKDPQSNKTKFCEADEMELSRWMCGHLVMYSFATQEYAGIELELINRFNPPLNIKDNHNVVNKEFRNMLSELRKK